MKPLPKQLRKHGYTLSQIWREGDLAIYRQHVDGINDRYEVIVIKEQKARIIKTDEGEKQLEAAEKYPGDEEWGLRAWTLWDRKAAMDKVDEVRLGRLERAERLGKP